MDNLVLNAAQGSAYNLGSWLRGEQGADFGDKDLLKAIYAESPLADGGALSSESVGVRRMSFPVLLPSGGAGLSLAGLQGALRLAARPGASLDIQVDGQASAAAIRFDVLAGRVEADYSVRAWGGGGGRLPAVVKLDVAPFGYMPTWIVLASAASVGLPGVLTIPNASLLGDAPGFAEIVVAPTTPTNYPAGTWFTDALFWSVGARPSFNPVHRGASMAVVLTAGAHTADSFAPVSATAVRSFPAQSPTYAWAGRYVVASAMEPAYRGRFRNYAWIKVSPSMALPWLISADVVPFDSRFRAMASSAPVATVPAAVATIAGMSPAYSLIDLGELELPFGPSGVQAAQEIRFWVSVGTTNAGVATPIIDFGGFFLQPLDAPNGALPRGLAVPSIGASGLAAAFPVSGQLHLTSQPRGVSIENASGVPQAPGLMFYRGQLPMLGASTVQLSLLGAARKTSATDYPAHTAPMFAQTSVLYRPRFQFLKGV